MENREMDQQPVQGAEQGGKLPEKKAPFIEAFDWDEPDKVRDYVQDREAEDGVSAGEALCEVGRRAEGDSDYYYALQWYRLAAETGDARGWLGMGRMCRILPPVFKEGCEPFMNYYRKALEEGGEVAGEAANAIGEVRVSEEDYAGACEWFAKAAEAGCEAGIYNLAEARANGRGTAKDTEAAQTALEQLYGAGGAMAGRAAAAIGEIFCEAGDHDNANGWFTKAAEAGCGLGWCGLGRAAENGWGMEKNPDKARKFYEGAVELGDGYMGVAADAIVRILKNGSGKSGEKDEEAKAAAEAEREERKKIDPLKVDFTKIDIFEDL